MDWFAKRVGLGFTLVLLAPSGIAGVKYCPRGITRTLERDNLILEPLEQ